MMNGSFVLPAEQSGERQSRDAGADNQDARARLLLEMDSSRAGESLIP